jgi:hypothetical protein
MVSTTVFVPGSIRETALSPLFGTKSVPSDAAASQRGVEPTGTVARSARTEDRAA